MEKEKIYYAVIILISAVSILLSPFVYARRGRPTANGQRMPTHWRIIFISNIAAVFILLTAWWLWFR